MKTISMLAVLSLGLASTTPAVEIDGYGPWRLGMSREEVTAVVSHGPYSPVATTGGLETHDAEFRGKKVTASFVFGPEGLDHIQLWPCEADDFEAAVRAFYDVYLYLNEQLGPLHSDGTPIPALTSASDLQDLLPPQLETGTSQSQLDELPRRGSLQVAVHSFHLHPKTPPAGADVYGSLLHSPQLGFYWVFVFFKSPSERP